MSALTIEDAAKAVLSSVGVSPEGIDSKIARDDLTWRNAVKDAQAVLSHLTASGWAVVPIEPTKAMIDAWANSYGGIRREMSDDEANTACATADWQAMVRAAQGEGS